MLIENIDRWDRRMFNESLDENNDFSQIEKEGSSLVHNYADFMLDIFSGLYKYSVNMKKNVPENNKWASTIYDEITQLKEWRELKERTRMNAEATASATVEFCRKFMDAVPKTNKKDENGRPIIDPSDIDMSQVRRVARNACAAAAKEADDTNEAINTFTYGNGIGSQQYTSPTEKKEIANKLRNNNYIKKIAELAGRMRRIASEKQKQKIKHGVDELADITIGDDLARLVPAEISKLCHPLLKMDFRKNYLERNLVQYKLRGKERQGRGPLIICIDESDSMRGQKDIWSKAVALALLFIAQKQNRKYMMVHFDSAVNRIDKFTKKTSIAEIMDAISYFSGGGTNFYHPLSDALKFIKENSEFNKADIIFITDGESYLDENFINKFNADKQKLQFNVISILLSYNNNSTCNAFSNKVVMVHPNNDSEALHEMFSI